MLGVSKSLSRALILTNLFDSLVDHVVLLHLVDLIQPVLGVHYGHNSVQIDVATQLVVQPKHCGDRTGVGETCTGRTLYC